MPHRACYSRHMTARLSNLSSTRIEKLETFLVERWCLLRIHCEDGTVGTGEAGVHGWPRPTAAMIDEMKPYLVGRDPATIEHHAQALQRQSHFMGALVGGAISAIDIALWDIKAKRYGVPVYDLMGGKTRDRVRCYMHALGSTLDELVADAVAKKRQGFTAIRFSPFAPDYHQRKSFEEWVSEAERRVGAVHEALEGGADLCIELHRQMNPAESIALGQRLQKFHPYFYEDPMLPDSPAMMGDVQARSGLPSDSRSSSPAIRRTSARLECRGQLRRYPRGAPRLRRRRWSRRSGRGTRIRSGHPPAHLRAPDRKACRRSSRRVRRCRCRTGPGAGPAR